MDIDIYCISYTGHSYFLFPKCVHSSLAMIQKICELFDREQHTFVFVVMIVK